MQRQVNVGRYLLMVVAVVAVSTVLLLPVFFPREAPAAGGELGQTIEGCGSANFAWLKYPGNKFGIAFRAPKSGAITQITLQWKTAGAYGAGALGFYRFELQTNGKGNFPSGKTIGMTEYVSPVTAMDGYKDGALHFAIDATLTAGEIYHLVISNIDPTPRSNWSSPNTLMTRVQPWDGAGNRAEVYENGTWKPWSSKDNDFNVAGNNYVNGAHSPTMLTWADGSTTGDPYYSALVSERAYFYGSKRAGEFITWNQPSVTINKIGLPVGKVGAPGPLRYHFEQIDAGELATGVIATAPQIGSLPTWVYTPCAVQLTQGKTFRLWFDSPDSPNADNCYYQYIPYGETRPPAWLECGWGGTASYYTTANATTAWTSMPAGDLSFSLQ